MEIRGRVSDRDVIDAVLDLASVPVVLTFNPCGLFAALRGACFVDAADGVRIGVLSGDDVLAAISQFLFIPNDRLEESL